MKRTFKNLFITVFVITSLGILKGILELCFSSEIPIRKKDIYSFKDVTIPIILWWTPFTGEGDSFKNCGSYKCFFTDNRLFLYHPLFKAVIFYGSKFELLDLPLPRNGNTVDWALFHEESPKNTPILSDADALRLFNYTATFSRKSNFPLTLQYLESLELLTEMKYFIPLKAKNELLQNLSPVLYIHSDCNTPLERDEYVKELMKYISVDSYGICLQNKKLPSHLTDPMESMDSEEFFHFVARYKFTLAFENAVCEDYITEKLWRPLIVGSVPIYMGSPSVRDWLPNPNSAIIASDFNTPKELAQFLLELNNHSNMYENYLEHKIKRKISNDFLISSINTRKWGIGNDYDKGNMVEHFECFVCNKIHSKSRNVDSKDIYIANISHYDCPVPVSPLTHMINHHNWWLDQWQTGHCESQILSNFINIGITNFTHEEFYNEVKRYLMNNLC